MPSLKKWLLVIGAAFAACSILLLLRTELVKRENDRMLAMFERFEKEGEGLDSSDFLKNVSTSSVVLITTNQEKERGYESKVRDILKGEELGFEVGDTIPILSRQFREEDVTYGERQIVFFTGNPPLIQKAMTIRNGRVSSYQNRKLEDLIEELKTKQNKTRDQIAGTRGTTD